MFVNSPGPGSFLISDRSRLGPGWLRSLELGEESAEIIRDGEAARSAERVCGEPTRQHARRRGACSGSRLGVVRRISDHHSLGARQAQFSQSQPHKAGIRLAVFDIVAARRSLDERIDV